MSQQALSDIRVLDLSTEIGGSYCTRLLADLGAEVLMIEPPNGHPLRFHGPFPDDREDPEQSGLFLHLCANKQGLTLDLNSKLGASKILELVGQADLVVETFKPGHMEKIGLDFNVLSAIQPHLVLTSISHFGQYGPYSEWEGEEIVDYALGGYMYFGGSPDREPLMVSNNQAQLQAGVQSAIASLSAVWEARRNGKAQHVDACSVEAMLSVHSWTHSLWTHQGTVLSRTGSDAIKCLDGWVVFVFPYVNQNFLLLIDRPDLMEDRQVRSASWRTTHPEDMRPLLEHWCSNKTREQIFQVGQELRMPVAPVFDAADLSTSPYVLARDWFITIDDPATGPVQLPGFPYRLSTTSPSLHRPAPRLKEGNTSWKKRTPGQESSSLHPDRQPFVHDRPPHSPSQHNHPPFPQPFQGLRVIEVTNAWAGPLVGRMFGDLGADVFKIEPSDRLQGRRSYFPGNQAFVHYYDRSAFYSKFNRNKFGMTVDLHSPEGKDIFLRLAKDADIVVENNSPRVMPNLGLSYEVLHELNPSLIMASISGFGQTGPGRDFIAYGANIEASCGLFSVTGYEDDPKPYGTSIYYGDPIVGWHAVVAIMAALFHRKRTGQGQFIELSLQENAMGFFPEALLEYSLTGQPAKRFGNRHRQYAPQGCYPCFGDDMWMVISIRNDDEWKKLAQLLTLPEALDDRFLTVQGRRAHHDELDKLISRWTRRLDHHEASQKLQDIGIPAAPVLASWELISNLHYFQRGFYVPVPHKEMGVFPYPGMPWQVSGTSWPLRMPPPLLGEHNRLVLTKLLGMDNQEVDDLLAKGILLEEVTADFRPPVGVKRPPPL